MGFGCADRPRPAGAGCDRRQVTEYDQPVQRARPFQHVLVNRCELIATRSSDAGYFVPFACHVPPLRRAKPWQHGLVFRQGLGAGRARHARGFRAVYREERTIWRAGAGQYCMVVCSVWNRGLAFTECYIRSFPKEVVGVRASRLVQHGMVIVAARGSRLASAYCYLFSCAASDRTCRSTSTVYDSLGVRIHWHLGQAFNGGYRRGFLEADFEIRCAGLEHHSLVFRRP
mmetsp:Transcript_24186/g.77927  ORF Transcript_24186/g.77927 Transcript_24186/m.77927 type:complete len:229 (-) Transcript_24186:342-1028(-)